jgi:hypothetical protein
MLKVEIRVAGNIDEQWSEWLGGLRIHHSEGDETILMGLIMDQAALYGIIARLRDLGMALNSVICEVVVNDPDLDERQFNNSKYFEEQ